MDMIVNAYAVASGLWKKVAAVLPLVAGAGAVLVGVGSIALQLGHAGSAAAALAIVKGLSSTDPNVVMIMAGLTALGIHTNHQGNASRLDDHADAINEHATGITTLNPGAPAPTVPPSA